MKILIADKFSESHLGKLNAMGHEITLEPSLGAEDLPAAVSGYEALIVRSTKITPETIDAGDKLNLIIRAGAGVNTIAVDHAAEKGVFVCNTPGRNAVAVAELAMGLILSIDRNIPDQVADLRHHRWDKKRYSVTNGLAGRTLGIIGLGAIGFEVAKRAHAFDMQLAGFDPYLDPSRAEVLEHMGARIEGDVLALAATCDILTIHVPATTGTEALVSKELLEVMKPGAVIINTSRGSVIDEEALLEAMDTKGLRAGLDVYQGEPGAGDNSFDSTLAQHPSVYGTHHIGASTDQAQTAIADAVIETLNAFQSGAPINCVNLGSSVGTEQTVTIRHRNVVGVLAGVLGTLREAGINVEHMENFVMAGRTAASAVIHVVGEVSEETVAKLESVDNVIAVSVNSR